MQNDFSTFIHSYVLDSHMPARDLAKALGKPYSTLLRELNPYDSGAKLGAESLFQIMSITGNYKPIEFMAEKLGLDISIAIAENSSKSSYTSAEEMFPHITPGAFHLNNPQAQELDEKSCPNCGKTIEQDIRV